METDQEACSRGVRKLNKCGSRRGIGRRGRRDVVDDDKGIVLTRPGQEEEGAEDDYLSFVHHAQAISLNSIYLPMIAGTQARVNFGVAEALSLQHRTWKARCLGHKAPKGSRRP